MNQPLDLPVLATPEACSGRTFIVTGANSGLGFETAKHLVSLGASRVIMAVRNLDSGARAKADVEKATGTAGVAEVWHLDLGRYDSVKAFAQRAIGELDRIDGLIENAGVVEGLDDLAEGHPATMTVNVYSTFLLAVLLMPKLRKTSRQFNVTPHLVVISSVMAFSAQPAWDTIKTGANPLAQIAKDRDIDVSTMYNLSKLFEVIVIRHLASLAPVDRTGVVINLVCPGFCKTNISRNAPPEVREQVAQLESQIGRTAEQGSRALLFASIAGKESHGGFTADCEVKDDSFMPGWIVGVEAEEEWRRVWEVIAGEIESAAPGSVARFLDCQ